MSKTTRENIELIYAATGSLRAEDIPYDGSSSIKDKLDSLLPFIDTFNDGDLDVNGKFTVTHNKGLEGVQVVIKNSSGVQITPDTVTETDTNNVEIDLHPQGTLSGTWTVIVR